MFYRLPKESTSTYYATEMDIAIASPVPMQGITRSLVRAGAASLHVGDIVASDMKSNELKICFRHFWRGEKI